MLRRTPVAVLSGFLGSGRTTLLNHCRSVLLDVPAPLGADVREVVLAELAARVGRVQAFLAQDDRAAWHSLLDRTSPVWLGNRDDLALLTARTVHIGTKP